MLLINYFDFRYIEWSITENSGVRRQDAYSVFDKIGRSDVGYYIAKKFLFERIADIKK
jgi:aminopeptidase N